MAAAGFGAGQIFGYASEIAMSAVNNYLAQDREALARKENYEYNEKAARNADARTRALYNDLYAPSAQMKQLKDAGLSPSLMYGAGAAGVGGHTGAMGAGASGISPTTYGMSALDAAQIGLIAAQTDNVKAQTQNTEQDTKIKEIEESVRKIEFTKLNISANALFEYVNVNGERKSLYEFAGQCTSYENFTNQLRKMGIDTEIVNSEQGQQTLREIYMARKRYQTEIATLSEEETSANFQMAISNALQKVNYANVNAENIIQQLQTEIATNELTESQKDAWNDLLKKLEDTHPALKDIAVILGLIVTQFGGKFNANFGKTTQTQNRNIKVEK